jgi:hypothetical protein
VQGPLGRAISPCDTVSSNIFTDDTHIHEVEFYELKHMCLSRRAEGENPYVYPFRPIVVVFMLWIGGVVLLIAT